jgi:putative FmdB family regulatory protein
LPAPYNFLFCAKGLAMPIYAYRCTACGHAKDVLQKLSDPVLSTCPACGAEAFTKQVTAAGFQLKGSGWYATDFKGGGSAAANKAAAEAESGADAGKAGDKGEAKTERKAEAKTEGKAETAPVSATPAAPASGSAPAAGH